MRFDTVARSHYAFSFARSPKVDARSRNGNGRRKRIEKPATEITAASRIHLTHAVSQPRSSRRCVRRLRRRDVRTLRLTAIPRANMQNRATVVRCLRIRCNQTQNHTGKYRAIHQSRRAFAINRDAIVQLRLDHDSIVTETPRHRAFCRFALSHRRQ